MKPIDFRFDAQVAEAVRVAEEAAGILITNVTKETEANIRNLIVAALEEGMSPYDAARAIKPLIGLTSAQGQAALKYRLELVASGLSPADVEKQVAKYADHLLNVRAESIARTEIMDALNAGQNEAWKQAQDAGLLSPNATKEWITTPDELLCFAAGTSVDTPRGPVFIENLSHGDVVNTHVGPRSISNIVSRPTAARLIRIETVRGVAVATPDHPYLVVNVDDSAEWKLAASLKQGDWLCGVQDLSEDDPDSEGFDVLLAGADDTPSVSREPCGLSSIARFVSVPIVSIGLNDDPAGLQQEIDAVAADLSLLDEGDLAPLEFNTDHSLEACLAAVPSVAGQRTESASALLSGADPELTMAHETCEEDNRTPARLRAEATNAEHGGESLPAARTISVRALTLSAFTRAHGVSVSDLRGYAERLRADGAHLVHSDGASDLVTGPTTESAPAQVRPTYRAKNDMTRLAGKRLGVFPTPLVVATSRAVPGLERPESITTSEAEGSHRSIVAKHTMVYSLSVRGARTFIAAGTLVHNCDECAPMDGKTVPLGQSFPQGDPPLHTRCRCTLAIGRP